MAGAEGFAFYVQSLLSVGIDHNLRGAVPIFGINVRRPQVGRFQHMAVGIDYVVSCWNFLLPGNSIS